MHTTGHTSTDHTLTPGAHTSSDVHLDEVLDQVRAERRAQDAKWGVSDWESGTSHDYAQRASESKARCDAADAAGTTTWSMILEEECLEVLCEMDPHALRAELIQVAAVAVAWIESLDRQQGTLT
jgi:hypothetical protein